MFSEISKLKRSPVWFVCLITPLLSIGVGYANYQQNKDQLSGDWISFTAQTGLFYSLLFFSLSVGLVCATIWNEDKKSKNWNLVSLVNPSSLILIARKTVIGAIIVSLMHVIYCFSTILLGILTMIDDIQISEFLLNNVIPFLAIVPLVAFQNLISYALRSFAAPVGLCLVISVLSFAFISNTLGVMLRFVIPHTMATYCLALGSPAFTFEAKLSGTALFIQTGMACLLLTLIIVFLQYLIIERVRSHG